MRTLLIDGDVLLHKAAAAGKTDVQWSADCYSLTLDVAVAATEASLMVGSWAEQLRAQEVILAFSDPSRRYFRHDLYPAYKAGRSRLMPGWEVLLARVSAAFDTVVYPNLEADDVLGMLSTSETSGLIVSIDKDFRGVPCSLWNPDRPDRGVEIITTADADLFHLEQTLVGDRVDGYFGCPGIGKVRAARALAEDPTWETVTRLFLAAGLTEADALLQARLARILRAGEYDPRTREVTLWNPTPRI